MSKEKKEESKMENVIINVKDYIEEIEPKNVIYQTPEIDQIFTFLKLKKMAKMAKENIKKYTEKNKKIRNGKTVLKGTRITTRELILIISEYMNNDNNEEKKIIEYIREQYPSIDSEEMVFYGVLCAIKEINTLTFICKILVGNK